MAQNPVITIEMEDGGIIKAELYPDIAPNTVHNFLSLDARKEAAWEIPVIPSKENSPRIVLKMN